MGVIFWKKFFLRIQVYWFFVSTKNFPDFDKKGEDINSIVGQILCVTSAKMQKPSINFLRSKILPQVRSKTKQKNRKETDTYTFTLVRDVLFEVSQKFRALVCINNFICFNDFFSHSFCSMVPAYFFYRSLSFHSLAWNNRFSIYCCFQSTILYSKKAEELI